MQKINNYRIGKITYKTSLILLALLISLVCYKTSHIMKKIALVNQAIALYQQEKWIETEATLQHARRYKWFAYKEDIIDKYLVELDWITQFNPRLKQLTEQIKASYTTGEYDAFIKLANQYKESGFENLDPGKKDYLLKQYPLASEKDTGWKTFKASMEKALNQPIGHTNYIWAKTAIWDVPEEYFEGDKEQIIQKLFISCDTQLFEQATRKVEHYTAFEAMLKSMNELYIMNKDYSYTSEWLAEKVTPYIKELLMEKSKLESIPTFSQYASTYRKNASQYYKSEDIERTIEQFIEKMDTKAKRLISNRQYDEGIKLYTQMHVFKDYSNEIKEAQMIQKYDDSTGLLSKKPEEYSLIKQGEYAFSGNKYIVGLQNGSNILELLVIEGTKSDYTVTTYEDTLKDANIKDIIIENDLVILLKPSQQRTYNYQVMNLVEGKFKTMLEVEANSIEVIDHGMAIKINSPLEGYEGYNYSYSYTESGYVKSGIVANSVSLNDPNFASYQGKIIEFDCYIPPNQIGDKMLAMSLENNVYNPDFTVQVYKEDGEPITPSTYRIVGDYIGDVEYHDSELNMNFTRPNIKILEMK